MSLNRDELLELKEKIEEAQTKVTELNGHHSALMKQLSDDWDCSTVEEAEKKLKQIKKQIEKLDESIEEGTKEIEEKYDV
jgi:methyl-accepting chemotaxis protein